MKSESHLSPLFPWFGGKRWLAPRIWAWLGPDVRRYIEPFAGGLAVLLARPGGRRPRFQEIANDTYGLLANAYRALKAEPEAVIESSQDLLHEAELHARTRHLIGVADAVAQQLEADTSWYDVQFAGWWLWCVSSHLTSANVIKGHRSKPSSSAMGVHRRSWVEDARLIAERIHNVKFLCGDFGRVLTSSYLDLSSGLTGVYLDPPYDQGDQAVYGKCDPVGTWVRTVQWCVDNVRTENLRIVLSGYSGCRGQADLESAGFRRFDLVGPGGFAKNGNRFREACWVSPGCLVES